MWFERSTHKIWIIFKNGSQFHWNHGHLISLFLTNCIDVIFLSLYIVILMLCKAQLKLFIYTQWTTKWSSIDQQTIRSNGFVWNTFIFFFLFFPIHIFMALSYLPNLGLKLVSFNILIDKSSNISGPAKFGMQKAKQ